MDVLLLGGTAWLGSEVARQALARGHRVTALARGSAAPPDGVALVRADRTASGAYDDVVGKDWDLVVDVTGQPGHARSAVAALADRTARWVLVSTGSVYRADDRPEADESTPTWEPLAADEAGVEDYGPGKVACERVVLDALGERAAVLRAGLIGGPGDRSDRFGYYPAAFARAADVEDRDDRDPVLVPAMADAVVQTLDVRDLAAWVVDLGGSQAHGVLDAYGEPVRFGDLIRAARGISGHRGDVVEVDPAWLASQGVAYFMGPRSLPFWLPSGHELTVVRPSARARAAGLRWRPVEQTLAAALSDERGAGLGRARAAGLTRAEERDLLAAWADQQRRGSAG